MYEIPYSFQLGLPLLLLVLPATLPSPWSPSAWELSFPAPVLRSGPERDSCTGSGPVSGRAYRSSPADDASSTGAAMGPACAVSVEAGVDGFSPWPD
jgi:hypothetical protein